VTRRIRVEGVRRREIDTEQLALVYWLQAKRLLRERREQEKKAKERQQRPKRKREADHEQ
jgi:hypothetical protein